MTPNKNAPGFHHLALRARDFDATVRFYEDGLGFVRAYSWGEGDSRAVLLDMGDGNYLEIFAGGTPAPPVDPQAQGLIHFALRTPDVDAAHARALGAGATDDIPPKDVQLGGDGGGPVRLAFVYGPDGERIEFFANDTL